MMKKMLAFFFLFVGLAGFVAEAEAKWWIFGQSEDEVATRYLYLNDISYDELGDKVTLYRELLPNGQATLKGRGQAGRNKVGAVQISLDNGATWQKANLAADGSFIHNFTPRLGETYQLSVKILDTAGKSNDVEATRKELTVAEGDISSLIRAALDAMITAYQDEDPRAFMRHVDENFAGDATILDRGVRKDFTLFDNLRLTYQLNNVAAGSGGKIFASFTFSRQVTSARDAQTYEDRGVTEFIFKLHADQALVTAMKHPLIFGLSEAEDVATGVTNSAENAQTLRVSNNEIFLSDQPYDDDYDDGPGAVGIPRPTNLAVQFFSYPELTLTFDVPGSVNDSTYKRVLQWSTSPGGPWADDNDPIFSQVSFTEFTVHCRGEIWDAGHIYYRLAIENISDGAISGWSNVVTVP